MTSAEVSSNVADFLLGNFYVFAGISIACAVVSLVLLALDKQTKHKARIVCSSIMIALAVLGIILVAAGVV